MKAVFDVRANITWEKTTVFLMERKMRLKHR